MRTGESKLRFKIYNYIRRTDPEKSNNDVVKETVVATGDSRATVYRIKNKANKGQHQSRKE